ncbi:MAG: NAD-dependent malic enzyme [bacterium]|nr:NAD-dependent malic enzyme [bacterium]
MGIREEALKLHLEHKGKIEVTSKVSVENNHDLSLAYTPGVADACMEIHHHPDRVWDYTARGNLVAVVTDGTAVLGLGKIGPEAGMPVMEGKAVLFKAFGNVDAFPICLNAENPDSIIETVEAIAPTFGGINLEDIAAPECFYIEDELKKRLDIPVFHDDQHGTAVVVLAGLINALKITGKEIGELRVLMNGAGAAGTAISRYLLAAGVHDIVICDTRGALYAGRPGNNSFKEKLAGETNREGLKGDLEEIIEGMDLFIGVSVAGVLKPDMVRRMADDPIIFAMANPVPEITPDEARAAGASVIGTGRSDYPNQINNVLAFPGIFRGALDVRAREINHVMKMAASEAIAGLVKPKELNSDYIIPEAFDKRVGPAVAEAVACAARKSNVARL